MSDMTLAAQTSGGTPKISKISEAVIRIAGNSQDGIQAIGGFLARLAGRSEQDVMRVLCIYILLLSNNNSKSKIRRQWS